MGERLAESGVAVDLDEQRGQVDLRQSSGDSLGERVGRGGYLLGGQGRDDQLAVLVQACQSLRVRVGQDLFQIVDRGVQLRLQPLQLPLRVGVGAGHGAEIVTLRRPLLDGNEQRGRVGVAARTRYPDVARTQPGLHPVKHAEFPIVPIPRTAALSAGGVQITAPAGRYERRRGRAAVRRDVPDGNGSPSRWQATAAAGHRRPAGHVWHVQRVQERAPQHPRSGGEPGSAAADQLPDLRQPQHRSGRLQHDAMEAAHHGWFHADLKHLLELLAAEAIRPAVHGRTPLDRAGEAQAELG